MVCKKLDQPNGRLPGEGRSKMLEALWIVISRMVIIFAVLGVLYLAIVILLKLVRPKAKKGEAK